MSNLLDFKNPVFSSYALWSSLLVLKMLAMSILTAIQRFKTQSFANPEDAGKKKVRFNDDNVERVRRAHRNDLENILPFLIVGYLYVLTNPSVWFATLLFKIAAIARFVHTVVYAVVVIPQPARALSWFTHYAITAYLAVQVILYVL